MRVAISVDEKVIFHPFGGHDQLKKFARISMKAGPHLEGRETISSFLTALRFLLRPVGIYLSMSKS